MQGKTVQSAQKRPVENLVKNFQYKSFIVCVTCMALLCVSTRKGITGENGTLHAFTGNNRICLF